MRPSAGVAPRTVEDRLRFMRPLAATLCFALMLTDGCDDSTIDLSVSPSPSSSSISLAADSGVTALDSMLVNTSPHYQCTMGLRVRGSSPISGETALWTGGSYRLVESAGDGPAVPLSVNDLIRWFDVDRVRPGEVVTATRTFDSTRPFVAVTVTIQVSLLTEGESSRTPQTLSTSFGCG
jgi:hypothetical protein